MKIDVCIDALYWEKDPIESIREVVDAGQKNIEFWTWWNKDIEALERLQGETGFNLVTLCVPFVGLNDPAKRQEYIEGVKNTIPVAKKLGCNLLSSQLGTDNGAPRIEQYKSMLEGLRQVIPMVEAEGMRFAIEPLQLGKTPSSTPKAPRTRPSA